jgi:hypothetical protein
MPLKNYLIKTDGKTVCGPYSVEKDGEYFFEILSLNDQGEEEGLYSPPFAARLTVKNGEIASLSDCFSAAKYKTAVELSLIPRVLRLSVPESTLSECSYTSQNRRYDAAVIRGAETVLSVECADRQSEKNIFRERLPNGLKGLEMNAAAYGKRQYLIVKGWFGGVFGNSDGNSFAIPRGGNSFGNSFDNSQNAKFDGNSFGGGKNCNYLLVAESFGDGFEIIFEESADLIETENQTVSVTKKFADMLLRERTERYIFDGAPEGLGAEFFYGADLKYKDELLPYLFLEALGAGDFSRATKYLADDLRENLREIAEYFGGFFSIDSPKHSDFGIDAVALKYRDGKNTLIKYYRFEIENGLIKNFDELEF